MQTLYTADMCSFWQPRWKGHCYFLHQKSGTASSKGPDKGLDIKFTPQKPLRGAQADAPPVWMGEPNQRPNYFVRQVLELELFLVLGDESVVCRQQEESETHPLNFSHDMSRLHKHSGCVICACRLTETELKLLVSTFQEAWAAQDENAAYIATAAEVANEASSVTLQEGPADSGTNAGEQTIWSMHMFMAADVRHKAIHFWVLSLQAKI